MGGSTHDPTIHIVAGSGDVSPTIQMCRRLFEAAATLDDPAPFSKGQLVQWKDGLRNRGLPAYGAPAIVREVLSVPDYEECENAKCALSAGFREPLTLVIGVIDDDGDFLEFRVDGRRLKQFHPWKLAENEAEDARG